MEGKGRRGAQSGGAARNMPDMWTQDQAVQESERPPTPSSTDCSEVTIFRPKPNPRTYLLCVDPGTTHLAMAVFSCGTNERDIVMEWNMTYNVGHHPCKIAHATKAAINILQDIAGKNQHHVLVEYQAPIGMAHTARWNAYVEGCVTTIACERVEPRLVCVVNASACKRKLGLATGNYAENKRMSLLYARAECPSIGSHHVADCYVLARYYMSLGDEKRMDMAVSEL